MDSGSEAALSDVHIHTRNKFNEPALTVKVAQKAETCSMPVHVWVGTLPITISS